VVPAPDLVSLTLIFCAAALATIVSRASTRLVLPTVVVEILLGILIGPELLDIAEPDPYIQFLSGFGLVVLFFLAGIEVIHSSVPSSASSPRARPASSCCRDSRRSATAS
jgi:Kef-type K+ transport system membrane component KefB